MTEDIYILSVFVTHRIILPSDKNWQPIHISVIHLILSLVTKNAPAPTHTQTHACIEMERNFWIREVTVIRLSCKYIISINSTRPFINLTHSVLNKLRFLISGNRINSKGEGKGAPITGHEGPEGELRYSPTLSWPRHLDGGGWSAPRPVRFTPWKDPVHIVQESG